jgi:hypothetical protein
VEVGRGNGEWGILKSEVGMRKSEWRLGIGEGGRWKSECGMRNVEGGMIAQRAYRLISD